MLPVVINAQRVHPFKFHLDGKVRRGMTYDQAIYGLVYECDEAEKIQMYELGCKLLDYGFSVVITMDTDHYALWIQLNNSARQSCKVSVKDLSKLSVLVALWIRSGAKVTNPETVCHLTLAPEPAIDILPAILQEATGDRGR